MSVTGTVTAAPGRAGGCGPGLGPGRLRVRVHRHGQGGRQDDSFKFSESLGFQVKRSHQLEHLVTVTTPHLPSLDHDSASRPFTFTLSGLTRALTVTPLHLHSQSHTHTHTLITPTDSHHSQSAHTSMAEGGSEGRPGKAEGGCGTGREEKEQDEMESLTKTSSTAHLPGDRPHTSEKLSDEDAHVQILRAFQKKVQ